MKNFNWRFASDMPGQLQPTCMAIWTSAVQTLMKRMLYDYWFYTVHDQNPVNSINSISCCYLHCYSTLWRSNCVLLLLSENGTAFIGWEQAAWSKTRYDTLPLNFTKHLKHIESPFPQKKLPEISLPKLQKEYHVHESWRGTLVHWSSVSPQREANKHLLHWWTHFAVRNLIKNITQNSCTLYIYKTHLHTNKSSEHTNAVIGEVLEQISNFLSVIFHWETFQKKFCWSFYSIFLMENWNSAVLFQAQTELSSVLSHTCGTLGPWGSLPLPLCWTMCWIMLPKWHLHEVQFHMRDNLTINPKLLENPRKQSPQSNSNETIKKDAIIILTTNKICIFKSN